jgi:hypothetical protein
MEAGDFVLIDLRNWQGVRKAAVAFVYRQRTDGFGMLHCTSFGIGEKCALMSPAFTQFGLD